MAFPRRFDPEDEQVPRKIAPDDAVRSTDEDALVSKLSAVALGYLDDPFAPLFTKSPRTALSAVLTPGSQARRAPLINVGTHHRTWAVDKLVRAFLMDGLEGTDDTGSGAGERSVKGGGKQIVSLGAGSDTRFWRLMAENIRQIVKYVEIDFPHNTSAKARKISLSKELSSACYPREASEDGLGSGETGGSTKAGDGPGGGKSVASGMGQGGRTSRKPTISKGGTMLESPLYILLPLDLRDGLPTDEAKPSSSNDPHPGLTASLLPHLDPDLPTLFIAECLLCYLPPSPSHSIIRWFSHTFSSSAGIIYEMHGLDDAFGQVMRKNLGSRGIPLPGARGGSGSTTGERFVEAGFKRGRGTSLSDIRRDKIPKEELKRISALEMLDEVEELDLVLDHYSVAWGWRGLQGEMQL